MMMVMVVMMMMMLIMMVMWSWLQPQFHLDTKLRVQWTWALRRYFLLFILSN